MGQCWVHYRTKSIGACPSGHSNVLSDDTGCARSSHARAHKLPVYLYAQPPLLSVADPFVPENRFQVAPIQAFTIFY